MLLSLLFAACIPDPAAPPTATDDSPLENETGDPASANLIAFTRDLRLSDVIGSIQISSASSIWVVDPDEPATTAREVVSGSDGGAMMPSWSPDKRELVFSREDLATGWLHLWVVGIDGSGLRQLTSGSHHDWTPAWSPDGSRIAYASTSSDAVWALDVWIVDTDGGNAHKLADNGLQDEDPVFSADGQTVYYVAEGSCYGLWQVDVDGGSPQPVRDSEGAAICGEDPSLSADGTALYFWRYGLQRVELETGVVTALAGDALEPWAGPDDERYVSVSGFGELGGDLRITGMDGSGGAAVTSGERDFFPRW